MKIYRRLYGGGQVCAPPPYSLPRGRLPTIQTSVNFATLRSYIFVSFQQIILKLGSFTNLTLKALSCVDGFSPTCPCQKLKKKKNRKRSIPRNKNMFTMKFLICFLDFISVTCHLWNCSVCSVTKANNSTFTHILNSCLRADFSYIFCCTHGIEKEFAFGTGLCKQQSSRKCFLFTLSPRS